MSHILLTQLPIPQLNYGLKTGNIPLAAACLKQAGAFLADVRIDLLPESLVSYLGDAALIRTILVRQPDVIGFSIFNWNLDRSLYVAEKLKQAYNPRIVFGGPEVTPDNPRIINNTVDQLVFGPGENAWQEILGPLKKTAHNHGIPPAHAVFQSASSPYLLDLLEPGIDNMVYFESQRGCPYRCGFCYYNKSNHKPVFVRDEKVLEIVQWTLAHGIGELSLVDPSLNIRPGLKKLLREIAGLNPDRALALSAEIRAEAIDASLTELFSAAGFTSFEIGLQTITPAALEIMQRATDPKRFLEGVRLLKERGIVPRIDLIVGLPGDTPQGFQRSLDFVQQHELYDDVQIFPLSLLPGTDFRQNSRKLGLAFTPAPPYTVVSTPTFSSEDIMLAFEKAEAQLDTALFPVPHLNICLRNSATDQVRFSDQWVCLGDRKYLYRLFLHPRRNLSELAETAGVLTNPYQILIPADMEDPSLIGGALEILTSANPFTPFELVFIEPAVLPRPAALLRSVQLALPHYLDNDLRFLYPDPGNRAVLFTLLSVNSSACFQEEMQRQIFWWQRPQLPDQKELKAFDHLDGILMDSDGPSQTIAAWQNSMAPIAPDLPPVCFARTKHQQRWLELTMADQYVLKTLPAD